jgi:Ca2+-binding RTX toxin-like protein
MSGKRRLGSIAVVFAVSCHAFAFAGCSDESGGSGAAPGETDAGGSNDGSPSADAQSAPPGVDGSGKTQGVGDFGGIDVSGLTGAKVHGCDAFDPASGALTLTLDSTTTFVVIDAWRGAIRANDIACSGPDGSAVTVDNIRTLTIDGTGADERVLFDMLPGDFGSILGTPSSIKIDLGAGNDTVLVRATRGGDAMRVVGGAAPGENAADLGGNATALAAKNVEAMTFSLGPGNDAFSGAATTPANVPLTIFGGADDDILSGGAKNDVLNAEEGNDTIDDGASASGADVMNGGPGEDTITYERRTAGVTIALCNAAAGTGCSAPDCACPQANGGAGENDTLVNFENASGGAGDDVVTGESGPNTLSGRGGNDHLDGADGQDQIYGDEGDDVIVAGGDDDILTGGPGKDTLDGNQGDNICLYDRDDAPVKNCQTAVQR